MFTDHVKPDKKIEYENWSKGINGDAKKFSGFLSVDIIRTEGNNNFLEYITLVKFTNYDNLMHWRKSANLNEWLKKLPELLISNSHAQESVGLELWFDRPSSVIKKLENPPFWKQVIIGTICVYPLIIFLNWALKPLTKGIPINIALLINVIILSSLLAYPVMPWITRLLSPWLYPNR